MSPTPKGVDDPTPKPAASYRQLKEEQPTYAAVRDNYASYADVRDDKPKEVA